MTTEPTWRQCRALSIRAKKMRASGTDACCVAGTETEHGTGRRFYGAEVVGGHGIHEAAVDVYLPATVGAIVQRGTAIRARHAGNPRANSHRPIGCGRARRCTAKKGRADAGVQPGVSNIEASVRGEADVEGRFDALPAQAVDGLVGRMPTRVAGNRQFMPAVGPEQRQFGMRLRWRLGLQSDLAACGS